MDPEVESQVIETPAPDDKSSENPAANSEIDAQDGEAQGTATEEGTSSEDGTDVETKPKSGFERRVAKLTTKAREAEQEVAFWKAKALEAGKPAVSQPEPTNAKPTFDQYNDIEAYASAVSEWTANKVVNDVMSKREQERSGRKVQDTYLQRVADFKKTTPDFDEVFEDLEDVTLAPELVQGIMDSDVGPQLAYHLARNLDTVQRLNALSPHRRLIELGKLEVTVAGKPAAAGGPKVSRAPAPQKTPTAKTGTSKNWEEMSPEEFIRERNKTDPRLRR